MARLDSSLSPHSPFLAQQLPHVEWTWPSTHTRIWPLLITIANTTFQVNFIFTWIILVASHLSLSHSCLAPLESILHSTQKPECFPATVASSWLLDTLPYSGLRALHELCTSSPITQASVQMSPLWETTPSAIYHHHHALSLLALIHFSA